MLIDRRTTRSTLRTLNRTQNLWLLDYTKGAEAIGERLRWGKASDGHSVLLYP